MVTVKEIPTVTALDNIFGTDNFEFVRDMILDSEEVFADEDSLSDYIINTGMRNRTFTNLKNSPYKWLGIYDNQDLIGVQIICVEPDHVELIVAEKKPDSREKIFAPIVNYIIQTYNRDIITLPINDKLKEHYKQEGFVETDNEHLILYV